MKLSGEMREAIDEAKAQRHETRRATVPALEEMLYEPIACLDHGFVRCVDYMGDDSAIVQAARVSYGKGTKKLRQDRGLIRYLMRHRHCYDAETEVLTEEGWKRWPDVQDDDKLGIWDHDAGTLCYEAPQYLTEHEYKGRMYRVDHLGVDLLVTPEHKMWVSKDGWDPETKTQPRTDFELVPAEELGHRTCIRYSKLAPFSGARFRGGDFPRTKDPEALLRLLGFFVGDGSATGTRADGLEFHLREEREIDYLIKTAGEVGWEIKEFGSYDGRREFVVYAEGITKVCRQSFYVDKEKRLPPWALMLDRADARHLLDGLRNSDGSEKRGTWVFATRYARLAEQVQLVALHAGEAASACVNCEDMWTVNIHSRMREPVINQEARQTSWEDYDGKVYCAHTRTGVLVVRRNRKIVLSGNTTPLEMCELKLHVKLPIFVARQWIRHRTANVNEYSARYSVLDKEFYIPEVEHLAVQSKDNKQGRGEVLSPESAARVLELLKRDAVQTYDTYEELMDEHLLARELARMDLPVNYYTQWYWKIDLHNLLHFLSLRMHPHAQYEIRVYGEAIASFVEAWVPAAWEAFVDYRLHGAFLSRASVDVVRRMIAGEQVEQKGSGMSPREWRELMTVLKPEG